MYIVRNCLFEQPEGLNTKPFTGLGDAAAKFTSSNSVYE